MVARKAKATGAEGRPNLPDTGLQNPGCPILINSVSNCNFRMYNCGIQLLTVICSLIDINSPIKLFHKNGFFSVEKLWKVEANCGKPGFCNKN